MLSNEDAAALIYQLYLALDEGRIEDMAAAFAPDGVWLRQGEVLSGPEGVATAFAGRPAGLRTAHVISNFWCEPGHGDEATCPYYMTAYRHDGAPAAGPSPSQPPYQVARVKAVLADRAGLVKVRRLETLEVAFKV